MTSEELIIRSDRPLLPLLTAVEQAGGASCSSSGVVVERELPDWFFLRTRAVLPDVAT